MLPDCDGFLPISSKLDYIYRFSRHLTHRTNVLTICLPPAGWGPWALPSQCGGNIVRFRWISSNFVKTRLFTWNLTSHTPDAQFNPFLPPPCWGLGKLNCQCSGNIARFWQISSNLVKLNYLYRFNRQQAPIVPVLTFVSQLFAEDPGPSIPNVVVILPDFDGLLQLSSKLDYLYRFSRNPTPTMPVLTLCLPPARWGPKAPDSECNGNIASFRRISSNLTKTRLSIQI